MAKIPVILDTDIGSDIDDAVCLAYLLAKPQCELLGVTTVSGEPVRRAMLADAICKVAGRTDVPIHAGSENPLLIDQRQTKAPQASVLEKWPHREDFEPNSAVSFLRETIRSRPGEITLLAVGPLTNIALLFRMDPEIPSLLKSLWLMGGAFSYPLPRLRHPVEWNILLDPHAASIVYGTEGLSITSIGLDVTTQCVLSANECRERFRGGVLDLVREAAEVWFQSRPEITFHDPLAAAGLFNPELMEYETGEVQVELQSDSLSGLTLLNPTSDRKNHKVAMKVDVEGFFAEYFGTVSP